MNFMKPLIRSLATILKFVGQIVEFVMVFWLDVGTKSGRGRDGNCGIAEPVGVVPEPDRDEEAAEAEV